MSKKHVILWIDDEWDKMSAFRMECEDLYNLILEPYKTCKEGLLALERDLDKWDAVLLDAKMLDESENEVASLKGLGKAKKRLDELSSKKKIPYFIFTGQPDLSSDDNFSAFFGEFYVKSRDEKRLLDDIVTAINLVDRNQIKSNYQDLFSSLESLGISEYTKDTFLDILLPLHYKEKEEGFRPVHHYTQLRKVIEYLFRVCGEVGLVPEQCIENGLVNLNQCSVYLSGKITEKLTVKLRYIGEGGRIVPEYIEKIIHSVLNFGNTSSHTIELNTEDKEKIENLFKSLKSNYLIYGLTLQLCEAVVWFANYIPNHNDKEYNLSLCEPILYTNKNDALEAAKLQYEGNIFTPEKDEEGFWHCEECSLAIKFWNIGDKMQLRQVTNNTNDKTKNKYPYFAKYDKVED